MNSYEVETYEDFLQAITELYDQNKLDFNNYKLLKNEIKKLESNCLYSFSLGGKKDG